MRRLLASTAIAAALLATATLAALAQSEAPKPAAAGPALGGYCPMAYVEMNQAMKGDPQQKSEYQRHTYYFTNAQAKQMFDKAPAKYVPAYDGLCATAVAMGTKLESDPKLFVVHDGRTYLFSNAVAKATFEKDPKALIAKADANWSKFKQQR